MWWQGLQELVSGKAFTPDEEDIGFPLELRIGRKPLLVVQQQNQRVQCQVVQRNKNREWVVIHAEDMTWDVDQLRNDWMRLQINLKVEYAVWIEDGEWEVHGSRMRWNGSGRDLQNSLFAGEMIPAGEKEAGRAYAPLVLPTGEVLMFSIRKKRMEETLALLHECGYRVVRTGILMAMVGRYLLPQAFAADVAPKYWLWVSTGSVLMLYQSAGQIQQLGQWCGDMEKESREELYQLWEERMKDPLADIQWVLVDEVSPEYEFAGRKNLYQHIQLHAGADPVAQWDPLGDVQPELRQEYPQTRPCLSLHWKMAWKTLWMAYLALFAWWSYELWQGRQLMREMQSLGAQEEQVREHLVDLRAASQGLLDEQEEARRMGTWVRSLIYTPQLVPLLASVIPAGVTVRDFTLRLFEGQRQVEIVVEMTGSPRLLSQASPWLIRRLEESGFQMVSLDQSDSRDGLRFRGIFLHLPSL